MTPKSHVADAIDVVYVHHVSGGISTLTFKSYDQGAISFAGSELEVVWPDEEPPPDVYSEMTMRTMTTDGIVMMTFTPLQGYSETVKLFMPNGPTKIENTSSRYTINATWDDAPHLTKAQKDEYWASMPPYQRDARSKGIPQLGSGAIYPLGESEITCKPFEIPETWPRAYALDVGWNRTACLWGAEDKQTQTVYLYAEHYRGQAEPAIHAEGIKAKGDWIPGVIDPAANGRSQRDGTQLKQVYKALGLILRDADNAVEGGIADVWQRMSAGKLKVFTTCENWLNEYRQYRRDQLGRVVKENDHLMDCTRYLIRSGIKHGRVRTLAPTIDLENLESEF